MIKRYLVFAWSDTEAEGGWGDLYLHTNNADAAIKEATEQSRRTNFQAEVIDLEVGLPVWRSWKD